MKKISNLADSSFAKVLYEFLDEVKTKVADVRNPMNCKPELEKDVRLAVCQVIDEMIINEIKLSSVTASTGNEEYT